MGVPSRQPEKIDRKKSETTTHEAGNNQLIVPKGEGEVLREEEVVGRLEDGGRRTVEG